MINIKDKQGNPWYNSAARKSYLNGGVDEAHTCIHIQCEGCWMHNLEDQDIIAGDEAYIMCLRQANLDAMAGKAKSMINLYRCELLVAIRNCEKI